MNTEIIEQIFLEYLISKQTKYAILINGKWGSGKTYFWEQKLKRIAQEKGFDIIYISLNGISKIENLDHLLFIKLLPFINNQENKTIKGITSIATNLLNVASKKFLQLSLNDLLKDLSVDAFNFSNYIICFDDLERCQISIKEVFGFINNLIEHKSLKTIILSDLANIDESQNFDKIKEKVIGRELIFEPNINEVIPLLFDNHKNQEIDFYNFLYRNHNYIVHALTKSNQRNLRSISFYLDILNKLFIYLASVEDRFTKEVIFFCALVCTEFNNGNLKSHNYNDYMGLDHMYIYQREYFVRKTENLEDEKENQEKPYNKIFYETYLIDNYDEYFFYPSIYSYILSGYIDLSKILLEIKGRYSEAILPEFQKLQILCNYKFRQLSNDDFLNLTKDVLNFSKSGIYDLYDYVTIATFFYFFSDNKLISESIAEINEIIFGGLEIAKTRKEIDGVILENLLHFEDENPEVTKVKLKVKEIHSEIKREQHTDEGNKLIESILSGDEYELAAIFEKHKVANDVFQYTDTNLLFNSIINTSNKQIFNFTEQVKNRYKISNIGEYLYGDYVCLKTLEENMSKYLFDSPNLQQPKMFLFETLINELSLICRHLDNTKKR